MNFEDETKEQKIRRYHHEICKRQGTNDVNWVRFYQAELKRLENGV